MDILVAEKVNAALTKLVFKREQRSDWIRRRAEHVHLPVARARAMHNLRQIRRTERTLDHTGVDRQDRNEYGAQRQWGDLRDEFDAN